MTLFEGCTPLMQAILNNDLSGVQSFLTAGRVNVDAQSMDGDTALMAAVQIENPEIINLLMAFGATPAIRNNAGLAPLHIAARKGNLRVVQALLSGSQTNVNIQSKTGETPLCYTDSPVIASCLLARRANPNKGDKAGNTPLHRAILTENWELADILLQKGADINIENDDGFTPINVAQSVEAVQYLLDHGADPTRSDEGGNTILHKAAMNGDCAMIKALLSSRKIDVNVVNENGNTPLNFTCSAEAAKLLLSHLANPTLADEENNTPLHHAAEIEDIELMSILLADRRVDVNAQNDDGQTSLHVGLSGFMNPVETAQLLLKHGANASLRNADGLSAFQLAADKGIDLTALTDEMI